MTQQLTASGLNAADVRKLHVAFVPDAHKLHAAFPKVAAYRLPYFDLEGKPTKFYRLRCLEQPQVNGFDALTERDELRYLQPSEIVSEAYFPPLTNWGALAKDTSKPLTITEGEKKAAAATKAGVPCIGLGGVWMFKSARHGLPWLPALARLDWKGREVRVAFDSDALTNPDVAKAMHALCDELMKQGALPRVVRVPPLGKGKTGLDDYLIARGSKALRTLLESAEPFGPVAELMALNAEVAYVRDPGLVVVLTNGQKLTPSAFREHAFSNRYYYEEVVGKHGSTLRKAPVAPAWLTWEQRAELTRLTYKPGQPRVTSEQELNFWPGWAVEPKRGSMRLWNELLGFLFEDEHAARNWLEQWFAYPLQHPGYKLYTAAVLWGAAHGTGKTLLGTSLKEIYGRNATEIDDEHLNSTYNEWAENKQFVLGDDVTSGENRRLIADRLKFMITRERLRLNPKYVPSYEVPDCINYYFTSQHPDAFFIQDTDRRYFVHQVRASEPRPREFYAEYVEWLKRGGGAAALFYHLLQEVDTSKFDPNGPALETESKRMMQEDSLTELGTWVRQLRANPETVLRFGDVVAPGDLFSSADLHKLYDPEGRGRWTVNHLGRELKRAGVPQACRGNTVRTQIGQTRLYAVRNPEKWVKAEAKVAAREYERSRGSSKRKF